MPKPVTAAMAPAVNAANAAIALNKAGHRSATRRRISGVKFWGRISEIPHSRRGQVPTRRKTSRISPFSERLALAHVLLPAPTASVDVFRATVLSIALTVAIGQEAALICRAWCHPIEGTAAGCTPHDQTTPPGLRNDESCRDAGLGAIAFVREDARRGATALVQGSVIIPPFAFASSPRSSSAFLAPPNGASTIPLILRI